MERIKKADGWRGGEGSGEVVPKRDEATVQMPNWFAVFFFEDA
jgi:hypothetical protein